jgi:putative heme iron utilization protein
MEPKIDAKITQELFPRLPFKIQIPEVIVVLVLKREQSLDLENNLLQAQQTQTGFRGTEPLICTNNKMQREEFQRYLNLEPTGLLPIPAQVHQNLRHSIQRFTMPQMCHLHREHNQNQEIILAYLSLRPVSTIPKLVGVIHQEQRVHPVGFHRDHQGHQVYLNLRDLLDHPIIHQEDGMNRLDLQDNHQGHQTHQEGLQNLQGLQAHKVHQNHQGDHQTLIPMTFGPQE